MGCVLSKCGNQKQWEAGSIEVFLKVWKENHTSGTKTCILKVYHSYGSLLLVYTKVIDLSLPDLYKQIASIEGSLPTL